MVLRHALSGAALELPRDEEALSFVFHTHAGSETRAYLGSGAQGGIAFVPSERCPRIHQALASAPGSRPLRRSLVRRSFMSSLPSENQQDLEAASGRLTFGRWRVEVLQVQDRTKIVVRHGSTPLDWIELAEHGFVLSCQSSKQALVVESLSLIHISEPTRPY